MSCAALRNVLPGEGRDPQSATTGFSPHTITRALPGWAARGPPASEEDRPSWVSPTNSRKPSLPFRACIRQLLRKPTPTRGHLHHRIHERVQHLGQLGAASSAEDRHAIANSKGAGAEDIALGLPPDPGGAW